MQKYHLMTKAYSNLWEWFVKMFICDGEFYCFACVFLSMSVVALYIMKLLFTFKFNTVILYDNEISILCFGVNFVAGLECRIEGTTLLCWLQLPDPKSKCLLKSPPPHPRMPHFSGSTDSLTPASPWCSWTWLTYSGSSPALSNINTATLAFFWLVFALYIFSPSFISSPFLFL